MAKAPMGIFRKFTEALSLKSGVFRDLFQYYAKLLKFLGARQTLSLQFFGLLAGILQVVGLAALFPLLSVLLTNPDSFLNDKLGKIIPIEWIPNIVTMNLLFFFGLAIIFVHFLKLVVSISYAGLAGIYLQTYTADLRLKILKSFYRNTATEEDKDRKSFIFYLNSQLQQMTSFNWALLEANLKIYNAILILLLLVLMTSKFILAWLALIAVILVVLLPVFKWTRSAAEKFYSTQGALMQKIRNFVEGFETIKSLSLVPQAENEVNDLSKKLIRNEFAFAVSRQLVFILPEFLVILAIVLILTLFKLSQEDLALFATFGYSAIKLVNALSESNSKVNAALETKKVADDLYPYLEKIKIQLVQDGPQRLNHEPLSKIEKITINNLSVHFGPDKAALSQINLNVEKPGLIQVTGGNGSGKSTLLKCIARLVDYDGEIKLNETELKSFEEKPVYQMISYHGQNPFLISGSLLDNLALGQPNLEISKIKRLEEKIGIQLDTIFKNGLSHPISEDGSNLSGGELQLVCLFRTLLRESPIYILDEFSNHLSDHYLAKVKSYLKSLDDRFIFFISHHYIDEDAKIVRLADGKIIEENK